MEAGDIERYLAELGAELKKRGLRIVLYYYRKQRFGPVNKLNRYWISTSYRVAIRRMPKVLKTLWTNFLEEKVDHEI